MRNNMSDLADKYLLLNFFIKGSIETGFIKAAGMMNTIFQFWKNSVKIMKLISKKSVGESFRVYSEMFYGGRLIVLKKNKNNEIKNRTGH
jgi:hypothetical protein